MTFSTLQEPAAGPAVKAAKDARSIHGPLLDFLLLGGGSLIVLPLLALVPGTLHPQVFYASFLLSFAINYPHFAHSYQIFYRDFANKLAGRGYAQHLRYRYAFAGLVVPVLIVAGFTASYASGSAVAMGACANAMAFFVGWHYVKQGYGILIVDSVFHRAFFNESEKRIFRFNAYACWIFFFLLASQRLRDLDFLGLKYYFIAVPLPLLVIAGTAVFASTAATIWSGVAAARRSGFALIPFNGYVAYVASLYIWLAGVWSPAVIYLIPAFHSLQYLAIVWRYEVNRGRHALRGESGETQRDTLWVRFAIFVGLGVVLGAGAFVVVPYALDASLSYDRALFGSQLITFMFWIFINIHHYFLDNVMWRKDNPDVGKHLFGRP